MNDADVAARIRKAKRILRAHGEPMSLEPALAAALKRYAEFVVRTQDAMRLAGVGAVCTACAREDHGSCCFEGIEEGYGLSLLLLNLLMGCDVPERKEIPGSCFFVGERGCKLTARYYFCLHYLCPRLREVLGQERADRLLQVLGEELQAGWEAEVAVLTWLQTHGVVLDG